MRPAPPPLVDEARKYVTLGDHYMSNQQWNNAVSMYEKVLLEVEALLLFGRPLPSITPSHLESLERSNDGFLDTRADTAKGHDLLAREALEQIRTAQAAVGAPIGDVQDIKNVGVYQSPSGKSWFVSFHQSKVLTCGSVTVTVPAGPSTTFCFRVAGAEVTSVRVTGARAKQLSFLLAHVAWANVTATMRLYYQNQILISAGIPAIMAQARIYEVALCLDPDNAWALAHLGEVYRDIANGWPASVADMNTPDGRADDYMRAILYYEEALRLNPSSFWAHAHLGAAIVNVRGFAGFSVHSAPPRMPQLLALSARWFPRAQVDPAASAAWDAGQDKDILTKGKEHLETAQRLLGQYYPWAEAYYAYTLMLLGALDDDQDTAQSIGVLSTVYLTDAFYLQSTLLTAAFEPGELYVNGFFQMGLFMLWQKNYTLAWAYTCLGMQRLFKFRFLVGLEALLGYQLFANIAALRLRDKTATSAAAKSPLLGSTSGSPLPLIVIPETPYADAGQLVGFLEEVFELGCKGVVSTWLKSSYPLSSSITIGLLQVVFVLDNFRLILADLGGDGAAERLREAMGELQEKILGRLGMTLPEPPSGSKNVEGAYHDHLGNLFSQLNGAKPTYTLTAALGRSPAPH